VQPSLPRHPERSEGPSHPEFGRGLARSLAPLGMTGPSVLPSFPFSVPPYCAIVAKNSLLFLVRFIRSRRNSSASTGGMSARKLRRR
jgi:hypothetical protein